ncbi:MAG: guanylate kinase, partial [Syntrophomonadaceae bacterium]|nr:guanylate kinase [Syntrophomonadaceae bacterium]
MTMSECRPPDYPDELPGHLFVLSGPSGVGKGSISSALAAQGEKTDISISATTRAARAGEVHGRDYFFIGEEEFLAMIERDVFLEHAQVFDRRYGTPRDYVEQRLRAGHDVILEIDVQGARQVREKMPEAIGIFILPPSMRELERRLRSRGTDSEGSIAHRLRVAEEELRELHAY